MNDEIKEIKIGMYSTDEILEFMTDGEGRGFLGRSMYDAIIDYITNLQQENEELKQDNIIGCKKFIKQRQIIDKANDELQKLIDDINNKTIIGLNNFLSKLEVIQDELVGGDE